MFEACVTCSKCCKDLYASVGITFEEAEKISKTTGKKISHFAFQSQDFQNYKIPLYFLKPDKSGQCMFLKKENDREYCGIYENRPLLCKAFPAVPEAFCKPLSKERILEQIKTGIHCIGKREFTKEEVDFLIKNYIGFVKQFAKLVQENEEKIKQLEKDTGEPHFLRVYEKISESLN